MSRSTRPFILFLIRWLLFFGVVFYRYFFTAGMQPAWPVAALLVYGIIAVVLILRYPSALEAFLYMETFLIFVLAKATDNVYLLALFFPILYSAASREGASPAISTENVDDYNRTMSRLVREREEATASLYNKIRQHSTLYEIICLITGSLETDDILKLTVKRTKEELRAEIGFMMMSEKNRLCVRYGDGLSETAVEVFESEIGKFPFGRLVVTGESLRLRRADDESNSVFKALGSLDRVEPVRDLLVVPLKSPTMGLPARGVLGVANSLDRGGFDREEGEMIAILAGQAAIAMENAERVVREKSFLKETIAALAAAINQKHKYTHVMHSKSVAKWATDIARAMGLSEDEIEKIEIGALLHDIGKIAIPDSVLTKSDNLTEEEKRILSRHPEHGAEMLQGITLVSDIVPFVRHHHERWDGGGYPSGLKGEKIPLGVQIVALADSFDAMIASRPYHKPLPLHEAIARIKSESGKHFSPRVVEGFLSVMEKSPR